MKILIFIHSLSTGGAERVATNLANQWDSNDWDVTLVTVAHTSTDFYQVNPGVKRIGLNLDKSAQQQSLISAAINRVSRILALRRVLIKLRPDIALAVMTEANLTLGLSNWNLSPLISIGSERTHPPNIKSSRARLVLKSWIYGRLNAVVALTEQSAVWLRNHTRAKTIAVIPNHVTAPLPNLPPNLPVPRNIPEAKMLLAVGRLSPEKQFDRLVWVFGNLAPSIPDWNLVILGDGSERASLQALVSKLGLGNRISLPGRAGNLSDWYHAADLFVLTSRFEGFPNTIAEAMAHGLPVVSFDCETGPRDIIRHDIDGLLVEPNNETALENALLSLANNEAKRRSLANKCTEIGDRLSPSQIDAKWLELFKELKA